MAVLALTLLIGANSFAASAVETARLVEREAVRLVAEPDLMGLAVAMVEGDQIILEAGFGQTAAAGALVNTATRFRLASLSKAFASTLAGLLVEEGQLTWDDRIADQVSYFRLADTKATRKVTLEHLLSHRLGLPFNAYDRLVEANWEPKTIVGRFKLLPSTCPVGTCYSYQNVAYNLVSDVIDATTQASFADKLTERLLVPLNMHRANVGMELLQSDRNWGRCHIRKNGQLVEVDVLPTYYRVPASAGVNASASDMAIWLRAQMGNFPEVIPASVLASITQPRVDTPNEMSKGKWRRKRLRQAHYGMGWRIFDYAGEPMLYHAGAVMGYRGQIMILPQRQVGLVALWNSSSFKPFQLVPLAADRLLGLSSADWRDPPRSPVLRNIATP